MHALHRTIAGDKPLRTESHDNLKAVCLKVKKYHVPPCVLGCPE